jgi:hypothetical protein
MGQGELARKYSQCLDPDEPALEDDAELADEPALEAGWDEAEQAPRAPVNTTAPSSNHRQASGITQPAAGAGAARRRYRVNMTLAVPLSSQWEPERSSLLGESSPRIRTRRVPRPRAATP